MFCYSNGVNGLHTSLVLLKCLDFTWVMMVRLLGCSFILVALQLIHWVIQWPEVKNNNSSKVVFRYSAMPYWIQCLWQSTHIWLSSNTNTTFFFFQLLMTYWLEQHKFHLKLVHFILHQSEQIMSGIVKNVISLRLIDDNMPPPTGYNRAADGFCQLYH